MLELFVFFGVGALACIFSFAGFYTPFVSGALSISILITLVLFADVVMRYSSYLRESSSPLGFYEWAAGPLMWSCKRLRNLLRLGHAAAGLRRNLR